MTTVEISCSFCMAGAEVEVDFGDWAVRYISEELAFCPLHRGAKEFLDDQCPGCVAGWGDCGLYESFAYSRRGRSLSESDFATIRSGTCPKRVNGTFTVTNDASGVSITDLDLSAASPAGEAMESAIRGFIETWPTPPDWPSAPYGTERDDDQGRTWVWHAGWTIKPTTNEG